MSAETNNYQFTEAKREWRLLLQKLQNAPYDPVLFEELQNNYRSYTDNIAKTPSKEQTTVIPSNDTELYGILQQSEYGYVFCKNGRLMSREDAQAKYRIVETNWNAEVSRDHVADWLDSYKKPVLVKVTISPLE